MARARARYDISSSTAPTYSYITAFNPTRSPPLRRNDYELPHSSQSRSYSSSPEKTLWEIQQDRLRCNIANDIDDANASNAVAGPSRQSHIGTGGQIIEKGQGDSDVLDEIYALDEVLCAAEDEFAGIEEIEDADDTGVLDEELMELETDRTRFEEMDKRREGKVDERKDQSSEYTHLLGSSGSGLGSTLTGQGELKSKRSRLPEPEPISPSSTSRNPHRATTTPKPTRAVHSVSRSPRARSSNPKSAQLSSSSRPIHSYSDTHTPPSPLPRTPTSDPDPNPISHSNPVARATPLSWTPGPLSPRTSTRRKVAAILPSPDLHVLEKKKEDEGDDVSCEINIKPSSRKPQGKGKRRMVVLSEDEGDGSGSHDIQARSDYQPSGGNAKIKRQELSSEDESDIVRITQLRAISPPVFSMTRDKGRNAVSSRTSNDVHTSTSGTSGNSNSHGLDEEDYDATFDDIALPPDFNFADLDKPPQSSSNSREREKGTTVNHNHDHDQVRVDSSTIRQFSTSGNTSTTKPGTSTGPTLKDLFADADSPPPRPILPPQRSSSRTGLSILDAIDGMGDTSGNHRRSEMHRGSSHSNGADSGCDATTATVTGAREHTHNVDDDPFRLLFITDLSEREQEFYMNHWRRGADKGTAKAKKRVAGRTGNGARGGRGLDNDKDDEDNDDNDNDNENHEHDDENDGGRGADDGWSDGEFRGPEPKKKKPFGAGGGWRGRGRGRWRGGRGGGGRTRGRGRGRARK